MTSSKGQAEVERTPTGISGLDEVMMGGIPSGRSTLVTGTPGSGKTLFGVEFLAHGIADFAEPGVFVTFEEGAREIRRNMLAFGFPIEEWEREERWAFIEVPADLADDVPVIGRYDFGALIARIERAVERTGAKRIAVDSLAALFGHFREDRYARMELFRIAQALQRMGVTTVMTSERLTEHDEISRHGIEEFVLDNVIVLRHVLAEERRRRTIEVLKFRGAPHRTGELLFTIDSQLGITVLPLAFLAPREESSTERVSTGIVELDQMCGGGFYKDAIALVRGPTGSGKTLLTLRFLAAAFQSGQRCLLTTFDESRPQTVRNAATWGIDLPAMEEAGLLRLSATYPEVRSLEEHFLRTKRQIEEFRPERFVVDPLSALIRIAPRRDVLDFVVALGTMLREREVTTLFTSALAYPGVLGPGGVSNLIDVLILLHYEERAGQLERSIVVPQVRGSDHDRAVRPFVIDGAGIHIETTETSSTAETWRPAAAWPFESGEAEGGNS